MRLMEFMTRVNAALPRHFSALGCALPHFIRQIVRSNNRKYGGRTDFLVSQSLACAVTRRAGTGRLHTSSTLGGVCTNAVMAE